ncbi:XrtA system polysaccharide chain length determinant [uncultured Sphingomonas sp.]|uniref:XrtA system polysaccharide chain length determinant n=1 Tax=uncultured Sphingomonas sp. TaxID=158754 RepID=UPI0026391708|nr:XrtA system polysaccharide chain length determinant [uncultured Sphingomonas sp.]
MTAILDQIRVGIHAVWRRRWLALAVAWGLALVGWLAISLIPNTYESVAKIYIQPQSILPQAVGINPSEQAQDIDSVRQTLTSGDTLTAVIKSTDLARQAATPRDMALMVTRLQNAIAVKSTQDNLYQISVDLSGGGFSDSQNAHLAQAVANRLVDQFVTGSTAGGAAEAQRSLTFMDQQLAQRGAQLQDAEQKQQAFDQKFMGSLPGTGSIQQRMDASRAQLQDVESNLAAAQSALAAVNGQLAGTPATIPGLPTPVVAGTTGGARAQLGQLRGQLAQDQALGWTDQHPDVIALKNQIARLSSIAAAEPASGGSGGAATSQPNPAYMSMRAMVAEKQATYAALATRHAQIQADLASFAAKQASDPDITAQQAKLARDHDVLQAAYDKLLTDREAIKLRADAQNSPGSTQIRVIDAPTLSKVPAKPKRPLLLSGVLLLALAAGAGVAFLRAKLQTSYSTPAALAAASGLPVLGAVSYVRGPKQTALEAQQIKWFAGAGGALVGAYLLLLVVEFAQRGLMA